MSPAAPPARADLPREAHEILAALRRARHVLISSSGRLDGDGLGSELGLLYVCDALAVPARVVNDGAIPRSLRFLPGIDRARAYPDGRDDPVDLLVTVDCGSRALLGGVDRCAPPGVPVANIDHHAGSTLFGTWNWVDRGASATGEMVYELARLADVPITPGLAVNLYTAIVTDTGGFAYSNTAPRTHAVAAHLLACGAEPAEVTRQVHRTKRPADLALVARVIGSLRLHAGGRCAVAHLTHAMLRETGADPADAQDLVNIPKSLEGTEVAILLREIDGRQTKGSLRSEGGVDVNVLAGRHGGGGHARAAGCHLLLPLPEAEAALAAEVEALLAPAIVRRPLH